MAFEDLFDELRGVLLPYKQRLNCVRDAPGDMHIDTHFVMDNGKPLFFAAVQTRKRYVSFHLMPVYVQPGLLERISAGLGARQHGKSCFNFRSIDAALRGELTALTQAGYASYQRAGYV